MEEQVFYRVKGARADGIGPLRIEMVLDTLQRGFSLKMILVLVALTLFSTLLFMNSGDGPEIIIPSFLTELRSVLFCHLCFVLFWTLCQFFGIRSVGDAEIDPDAQTLFLADCFRVKNAGIISEFPYISIKRIKETPRFFYIQLQKDITYMFPRKNFIEGNPATFSAFLKNPTQKPANSAGSAEDEERNAPPAPVFEAGVVLNEEVYTKNRILQGIWAMKNMSVINFWISNLCGIAALLPYFFLLSWELSKIYRGADSRLGEVIFRMVAFVPVIVAVLLFVSYCVYLFYLWTGRKTYCERFRRSARREYPQIAKSYVILEPMRYRFYDQAFEVTQVRDSVIYEYSGICEMYQTECNLILLAGSKITAQALAIDKWSLGEDCQKLMEFIKQKTGMEWWNSPV